MLKAQDIVILLKILAMMALPKNEEPNEPLSQNKLALHLCMSVSEINAGIGRLIQSSLLGEIYREDVAARSAKKRVFLPIKAACVECLISGVKYFFPVQLGAYTRGIATSYAAPIFENQIVIGEDPIPVWPYAEGDQRGLALEPLYSSVPKSVAKYPDKLFYELLALIDAIRAGRARERTIAINLLKEKINDEK